ncbi:DUF4912 domain-containing protein [Stieleria varia]|uniref:DUF4912 domain-containing protein n=1 Tax=Stieleria varia TaxID=2528005 RepID=UPI0011B42C69|nr:DUF4912 domain-containing protein [Stieleria varia]
MIKTADLKAQTRRELATLAKNYSVEGWHAMKKDELVDAITKVQRRLRRKANGSAKPESKTGTKTSRAAAPKSKTTTVKAQSRAVAPTSKDKRTAAAGTPSRSDDARKSAGRSTRRSSSTKSRRSAANTSLNDRPLPEMKPPRISAKTARIRSLMRKRQELVQKNRDLSTGTLVGGSAVISGAQRSRTEEPHRDRIILLVRDSYWLQATWEITRGSVQRAQSSLAERWHTATPTLRVLSVGDVTANGAETAERDITIHGGVDTWYVDVQEPPSRFRVAIGYLTGDGEFYTICRSNVVETPRPGECERLDEHWHDIAEDYERIYSLSGGYDTDGGDLREVFEERLRRPMPMRGENGQTVAEPTLLRQTKLPFKVDAELIVFGKTSPGCSVNVSGRPVKLQADGSFTVRMELPDKRQVLPVTTESRDGLRQRTTVIAVERNTKVMETVELEDNR